MGGYGKVLGDNPGDCRTPRDFWRSREKCNFFVSYAAVFLYVRSFRKKKRYLRNNKKGVEILYTALCYFGSGMCIDSRMVERDCFWSIWRGKL